MKLTEAFPSCHVADLTATTKAEAVHELIALLSKNGALTLEQAPLVEKAILRREELGSTGIGRGVGVPHAKAQGIKGLIGAFGRSAKGIAFDSLDGQPVHLVFLLASAPDSIEPHLALLRKVTAIIKDEDYCAFLRRAKNRKEVLDLLREGDERLRS